MTQMTGRPAWAEWRSAETAYTLGVEEELMIVGGDHLELVPAGPRVLEALPPELCERVSPETHASSIEIQTGVQRRVAGAVEELAGLRCELARELEVLGVGAASADTHPLALGLDTQVSPHERYQHIYTRISGRSLGASRPSPLHVHVGLPRSRGGGARP